MAAGAARGAHDPLRADVQGEEVPLGAAGRPPRQLPQGVGAGAGNISRIYHPAYDDIRIPFQGTVLKKYNTAEESCYLLLMQDPLCQVDQQM